MTSRSNQYSKPCHSPGTSEMDLRITIGGSGAVSSVAGHGQDGVAVGATGVYNVTLERGYNSLRYCAGSVMTANATAVALEVRPVAYTAGSTTLTFRTIVDAGTATQPASGDVIFLHVVFDELGL